LSKSFRLCNNTLLSVEEVTEWKMMEETITKEMRLDLIKIWELADFKLSNN
jgi:hypothetical protein